MQEDNASGKRTTADSAGGAAEVSVGVERKHRRSPKIRPLEVMLEVRGSSVSPRLVCIGGRQCPNFGVCEKAQGTGRESQTWAP